MHRSTAILVCLLLTGCGSQEPSPEADHVDWKADYSAKVTPILLDQCADCHSGDEPESGVLLTSLDDVLSQRLVAPGDSDGSLLVHVVSGPEPIMPLKNRCLKPTWRSSGTGYRPYLPLQFLSRPKRQHTGPGSRSCVRICLPLPRTGVATALIISSLRNYRQKGCSRRPRPIEKHWLEGCRWLSPVCRQS